LVQEFAVKLDMGFITGLVAVFGAEQLETTPDQVSCCVCGQPE